MDRALLGRRWQGSDLRRRDPANWAASPFTPCQGEGRGFESRRPLQRARSGPTFGGIWPLRRAQSAEPGTKRGGTGWGDPRKSAGHCRRHRSADCSRAANSGGRGRPLCASPSGPGGPSNVAASAPGCGRRPRAAVPSNGTFAMDRYGCEPWRHGSAAADQGAGP
jgi:hypothetical protein